jgi:hypothetical protein
MTRYKDVPQAVPDSVIKTEGQAQSPELALAQSLISKDTSLGLGNADRFVGDMRITFPYQEEIDNASYNDYFPEHIWRIYHACKSIMNTETMPQDWIRFLEDADRERQEKGSNIPLDLISSVFVLSLSSKRYKLLQAPDFELSKGEFIGFTDESRVREVISGVIADPQLRQELIGVAATLIPEISTVDMDMGIVVEVLRHHGINSIRNVLLDLGCGIGKRTLQWHKATGITTIGLDRGYKEKWYAPVWHGQQNTGVEFKKADFAKNIPLPSDSVDAVIMENVIQHVLEGSLAAGIRGMIRVLRPNTGLFFVGPQEINSDQRQWRMFRKEHNPTTGRHCLVEYPITTGLQSQEA